MSPEFRRLSCRRPLVPWSGTDVDCGRPLSSARSMADQEAEFLEALGDKLATHFAAQSADVKKSQVQQEACSLGRADGPVDDLTGRPAVCRRAARGRRAGDTGPARLPHTPRALRIPGACARAGVRSLPLRVTAAAATIRAD